MKRDPRDIWLLTVVECVGPNLHGAICWRCKCDCGNLAIAVGSELISGNTKSCGCLKLQINNLKKV